MAVLHYSAMKRNHLQPTPLELVLPVPVAELDAYGALKTAAQFRLLQLAAARATAAAGFDGRWYDDNGVTWVVRYTHLEALEDARHDDELRIHTWVSDFRRVRSWRRYEIRRGRDGALLARARTDWVFVDVTTGAPAVVPDAIQSAFMPQGIATESRPKRLRFAHDGASLPLRPVEWADLDALGHVNNAIYAALVEQAVLDRLAALGWIPEIAPGAPRLRLRSIEIEYLTPALYRHRLTARVSVERQSERELRAEVELRAEDHPSVRAITSWQWSGAQLPSEIVRGLRIEE
jgi:acyl-CoA thioester hydrolase